MIVYAQEPVCNRALGGLNCGAGFSPEAAFGKFASSLVGIILFIASVWTLFQLLRGGFEWINSGGDKGQVAAARDRLTQAIIGFVVLVAAWAIFLFVLNYLGILSGNNVSFNIPSLF